MSQSGNTYQVPDAGHYVFTSYGSEQYWGGGEEVVGKDWEDFMEEECLDWIVSPPKVLSWSPNPCCDSGDKTFTDVTELKWGS